MGFLNFLILFSVLLYMALFFGGKYLEESETSNTNKYRTEEICLNNVEHYIVMKGDNLISYVGVTPKIDIDGELVHCE